MTTKERVQEVLDRLPDDCSLDEVLYHLYVLQAVERGLADAEAGRTIPHEKVTEELLILAVLHQRRDLERWGGLDG